MALIGQSNSQTERDGNMDHIFPCTPRLGRENILDIPRLTVYLGWDIILLL